jgi:hypothetical protein
MDLVDKIEMTRFVGNEFLTWLWYYAESMDGVISLKDFGSIELWFDQTLEMSNLGIPQEISILRADDPIHTAEAKLALQNGKLVTLAKLHILKGEREWNFRIKGETLILTGIKLPKVLSRQDDDALTERFYLLDELEHVLRALYGLFLDIRLDVEKWQEELGKMHQWVRA